MLAFLGNGMRPMCPVPWLPNQAACWMQLGYYDCSVFGNYLNFEAFSLLSTCLSLFLSLCDVCFLLIQCEYTDSDSGREGGREGEREGGRERCVWESGVLLHVCESRPLLKGCLFVSDPTRSGPAQLWAGRERREMYKGKQL